MSIRVHSWFAFLLFCALAGAQTLEQVVVIANKNVPESLEIAHYYMKARGIPDANLFVADLPARESITRSFYELRLRDPLLQFLRDRGLAEQVKRDVNGVGAHESSWTTVKASVRYLVSTYGVPLRVLDSKPFLVARAARLLQEPGVQNSAAVDSELALLLHEPYDIDGRVSNPMYDAMRSADLGDSAYRVLVAARLDGPDPAGVKRMIDASLRAETYGLHGRAYFDAQAPQTNNYATGNHWIVEACERFRREGFECTLDRNQSVWSAAYPMEDAAVYMGWYVEDVIGPFTRDGFAFAPGALAYHLHSGSAKTLRSSTTHWVGPLLARGAAASLGAVDEPYLAYTVNLQILADRLCRGERYGDSCYMAMPALSWQMTVVGDPLYTPFARSLDEQIAAMEKERMPEREWAYLRKINLLIREGRFNVALGYCRQKLRGFDSLVLREKLADLYAMNEIYGEAEEQYDYVVKNAKTPETALRVGVRYLLLLRIHGKKEKADNVEKALRERWKGSPVLMLLNSSQP
ncbi:MAG: TIGR03790 family protein [bacterium]